MIPVDKTLPKRKHPRLDNFDYSSNGAYFVTICTQDRKCVLSRTTGSQTANSESGVEYTNFGRIAEQQLLLLPQRYSYLSVDNYVIMPNHIHALFVLGDFTAGASPRPTLMDIVCTYKSLTARECKKHGLTGKLFQSSFYEHVIRCQTDYDEVFNYITENPKAWQKDKLFTE